MASGVWFATVAAAAIVGWGTAAAQSAFDGALSGTVRATAARFAPVARAGVGLNAGVTTVDLELPVAALTAHQEVSAPLSLVDVTTAAAPAGVTSAMLHDLPTSRVLSDLINLVPGVNGDVAFGGSRRSNAIYGRRRRHHGVVRTGAMAPVHAELDATGPGGGARRRRRARRVHGCRGPCSRPVRG